MSEKGEYDLGKSSKKIGRLYPILRDANGNIIDGFHRQNSDPDWEVIVKREVDTPVKLELARLAANYCRRTMPAVEIENRIRFLINNDITAKEIAETIGVDVSTVFRHMPQDLKDKQKVVAGSARTCEQTVTTQDLAKAEQQALNAQVQCQNPTCLKFVRAEDIRPRNGIPYCRECAPFIKEIKPPVPEEKKSVVAESWEERKKHMQTADPEVDRVLFQRLSGNEELRSSGWRVEYHQKHIASYVEDDVCLVNDKLGACLAVFFDGDAVHAKRKDKDEANREKAEEANDGLTVFALPYKSPTDKEFGRLEGAVLEKARALGSELEKWKTTSSEEVTEESS